MVRVEHVLESWKSIRQDTIAAVEEFPPAEFDFRASPDLMTFRELARHIAVAGHALTGMLLAGETDFTGPQFREKLKPHVPDVPENADAARLIQALRHSIDRRTSELAGQTPEYYAGIVTRVDGEKVTRLEMLQFVKEHELTHRSQMFMYLRLKGIVPATTRRRLARQAAK
jgi:uncharacterized damage-inducible protein DinB